MYSVPYNEYYNLLEGEQAEAYKEKKAKEKEQLEKQNKERAIERSKNMVNNFKTKGNINDKKYNNQIQSIRKASTITPVYGDEKKFNDVQGSIRRHLDKHNESSAFESVEFI